MLSFSSINPPLFDLILRQLMNESTVTPNGPDSYVITGMGVRAVVDYSRATEAVTVMVTEKPFYISESMIGSKVRNAIDAAQARIGRQGGRA
jgi:hypothetical protein